MSKIVQELTKNRETVQQIFGCLMNKPTLLDETDKYKITVNDFYSNEDKEIFNAIKSLKNNQCVKITPSDIENFLRDFKNISFSENNGEYLFLLRAYENCDIENFDSYYKTFKKKNLLISLEDNGISVGDFVSEDILLEDDENRYVNMSSEEILSEIKGKINKIESSYVINNQMTEFKPEDDIENFIKQLKEEPEIGCELQGNIFNSICRGGRKGKLYLRSALSGVGKAIPDTEDILTPTGWKKIGQIKEGDFLFDRTGTETKVLKIYPQREKQKIFRVFLESGKVIKCNGEHLWSVYEEKLKDNSPLFVKTTKELMRMPSSTFSVPICDPVEFKKKYYDIPPYKVGKIISDNKKEKSLINLNLEQYLFGSIDQRIELLKGIITECGIIKKNKVTLYIKNKKVKKFIYELCCSLGMMVKIIHKKDLFYISIIFKKKKNPFKINGDNEVSFLIKKFLKNRIDRDKILKIEETEEYCKMTCFYVDNPEHIFLVGKGCVCTHNTRNMVGDACNIAYPIRYDNEQQKWTLTGNSEKVLYVMTEQDPEEIKTMILAYLTGINEERFLYGNFNDQEESKIKIAIEIMKRFSGNIFLARVSDPCSSVIKNLFRRYHQEHGVENFFYDYIFSSPAMLEEYDNLNIQEHVILRMFTTELKNLAVELNSFILTSTQVNSEYGGKNNFKDYRMIRGSKAIQDLADFACIMSRPEEEDLKRIEGIETVEGIYGTPNLVTDIYKNRRGQWTMVRVWSFIDLGTCQKKDLFITTSEMKMIKEFECLKIEKKDKEEWIEMIEKYNKSSKRINFIEEEKKESVDWSEFL